MNPLTLQQSQTSILYLIYSQFMQQQVSRTRVGIIIDFIILRSSNEWITIIMNQRPRRISE